MNASQGKGAVLVTGASTGIGKATVLKLDELGFEVFASVRKEADAGMLRAEGSDRMNPVIMDVTDADSITRARAELEGKLAERGLAGLVNNAAISVTGLLEFYPLDEFRALYEVNLFGVLAVTQAFLPLLRAARGRIVNISSGACQIVFPTHGPYSSTKAALNSISHALRLELLPHDVQVIVVIPGSFKTAVWEKERALSDNIARQYPSEAQTLYGEVSAKMRATLSKSASESAPPEIAADTIVKALTEKRPKNTYLVGPYAQFFNIIDKLVYGKLRDKVIMRLIGLKA